ADVARMAEWRAVAGRRRIRGELAGADASHMTRDVGERLLVLRPRFGIGDEGIAIVPIERELVGPTPVPDRSILAPGRLGSRDQTRQRVGVERDLQYDAVPPCLALSLAGR